MIIQQTKYQTKFKNLVLKNLMIPGFSSTGFYLTSKVIKGSHKSYPPLFLRQALYDE